MNDSTRPEQPSPKVATLNRAPLPRYVRTVGDNRNNSCQRLMTARFNLSPITLGMRNSSLA